MDVGLAGTEMERTKAIQGVVVGLNMPAVPPWSILHSPSCLTDEGRGFQASEEGDTQDLRSLDPDVITQKAAHQPGTPNWTLH